MSDLLSDIRSYQQDAQKRANAPNGPRMPRSAIVGQVVGYDNSTTPATMIVDDMISKAQRRVIVGSDFWAFNGDLSHSKKRAGRGLDEYAMRARQTPGNKEHSGIGDYVCVQDAFEGRHSSHFAEKGHANTWVARRIVSLVSGDKGKVVIAPAILQFVHRSPQSGLLEPVARSVPAGSKKNIPYPCVCIFETDNSRICSTADALRSAIVELGHEDHTAYMPGPNGEFRQPPGLTYTLTFAAIDAQGNALYLPYNYHAQHDANGRIELTYLVGASRRGYDHPTLGKQIYCNDGEATLARIQKDQRLWGIMEKVLADKNLKGVMVIPGVSLPIGAASVNALLARKYVQDHYPAWIWPRTSTPPEFQPFAVYSVLQLAPNAKTGQMQAINEILPIYTDRTNDADTHQSVLRIALHNTDTPLGPPRLDTLSRSDIDWTVFDLEARRNAAHNSVPDNAPVGHPQAAQQASGPPAALQNFPGGAQQSTTHATQPQRQSAQAQQPSGPPSGLQNFPSGSTQQTPQKPAGLTPFPTDTAPARAGNQRGTFGAR